MTTEPRTYFGPPGPNYMDHEAVRAAQDNDPRWALTEYLVESTDCESLYNWGRWSSQSRERPQGFPGIEWIQTNPGYLETIGHLDKMPVCVSVSWDWIGGALVCSWHATSQVVDHRMIDRWLKKRFTKVKQTSDAMNLHNIIHAIQRSR